MIACILHQLVLSYSLVHFSFIQFVPASADKKMPCGIACAQLVILAQNPTRPNIVKESTVDWTKEAHSILDVQKVLRESGVRTERVRAALNELYWCQRPIIVFIPASKESEQKQRSEFGHFQVMRKSLTGWRVFDPLLSDESHPVLPIDSGKIGASQGIPFTFDDDVNIILVSEDAVFYSFVFPALRFSAIVTALIAVALWTVVTARKRNAMIRMALLFMLICTGFSSGCKPSLEREVKNNSEREELIAKVNQEIRREIGNDFPIEIVDQIGIESLPKNLESRPNQQFSVRLVNRSRNSISSNDVRIAKTCCTPFRLIHHAPVLVQPEEEFDVLVEIDGRNLFQGVKLPLSLTTATEFGKRYIEIQVLMNFSGDFCELALEHDVNFGLVRSNASPIVRHTRLFVITNQDALPYGIEVISQSPGLEVKLDIDGAKRNPDGYRGHSFSIPLEVTFDSSKYVRSGNPDFEIGFPIGTSLPCVISVDLVNYFSINGKSNLRVPIVAGKPLMSDVEIERLFDGQKEIKATVLGIDELKLIPVDETSGKYRLEFHKLSRKYNHGDRVNGVIRVEANHLNNTICEEFPCEIIMVGSIAPD